MAPGMSPAARQSSNSILRAASRTNTISGSPRWPPVGQPMLQLCRWTAKVRPCLLAGEMRSVFLVVGAHKVQQVGIELDALSELHGPRLGIGLGIVHGDLDFQRSAVGAPELFRYFRRVHHGIAGFFQPNV